MVHTFKDDVQNLVRNRKTSLTRIAAMESNRRSKESDAPEVETSNKKVIVIGLIILFVIILGVFGLGSYYAYQLNTSTESIPQVEPSFIFTEARERVDITDKNARSIVELLASVRRNTFFSLGSMIELYVTETIQINESTENTEHIGSQGFLQSINASVPATFIQTLGTDYVLGIHVIDENVPFIVLTTQSYGHAFAGMLQWENNMEEDLLPFFSPNAEFIKPAVAESSNSFKDEVIENLDVRILRDTDDEIRVVYAFVDRKTVLITTDIRTLTELANRARIQ